MACRGEGVSVDAMEQERSFRWRIPTGPEVMDSPWQEIECGKMRDKDLRCCCAQPLWYRIKMFRRRTDLPLFVMVSHPGTPLSTALPTDPQKSLHQHRTGNPRCYSHTRIRPQKPRRKRRRGMCIRILISMKELMHIHHIRSQNQFRRNTAVDQPTSIGSKARKRGTGELWRQDALRCSADVIFPVQHLYEVSR